MQPARTRVGQFRCRGRHLAQHRDIIRISRSARGTALLSVVLGVSREMDARAIDPWAGVVPVEPATIPSVPLSPTQIAQFREDGSIVLGRGGALGFKGFRVC
jgi:hypothetical protein